MRPILHPALSRTWRDQSTLQIGVTPGSAVVIGDLGPVEIAILGAMDGSHDLTALRELAIELGGERRTADQLVDLLVSAGVAVDAAGRGRIRPRLTPDRSSVGLQTAAPDGGDDALAARRRRRVDVHGAGRVGASIARLLAAAGIGDVVAHDPVPTAEADLMPGGLAERAVGRPRGRALDHALRAASTAETRRPGGAADFVVLAPPPGTGREEAAALMRHGIAHLLAEVIEVTGVVGPLVVPGRSTCLRCHDLHRTDMDGHWPVVFDQSVRRPPAEPACDAALAGLVAGLATAQVLAHLDGFTPAAVDGTIEVSLPAGMPRRRSWVRHPACGCGWAAGLPDASQWDGERPAT